jgi:hypothetical protein
MSLLEKATLITTPTAHSNGKLHSIKGGAVADFDVVRGSAATRVDAEGLIESVATNIPRIDYTTGEGVVLLEPLSTNLVTHSEDFSDASWSIGRSTITSNQIIAPDNTLTADKWQMTSDVGGHYIRIGATRAGGFTNSIYVKKGNYRYIGLFNSGATFAFDFDTEAIIKNTISGGVDKLSNGWYRIFTTNNWTTFSYSGLYYADASGNELSTANGDEFYYIWGAQLEGLTYPTSYIPTSGAIATRLADSVAGAGDATTFNSTEGVLYAEIAKRQEDNDNFILISLNNEASNSDGDSVTIGFNNSTHFYFRVKANGSLSFIEQSITSNKNQFYKVALKYKSGNISAFIDGVNVASNTTAFSFGVLLDNLSFDYNGNGTLPFYGKVKALAVFNEALTDSELECLTKI